MDHGRSNWPIVVGIAAGVLGGVAAAMYLHTSRSHTEPDSKLRDASELLDRCRRSISDLEKMKSDLDSL